MKCYFCHSNLEKDPDTSPGPFKSIRSKSCEYCTKTHNVHHVSFIYNKDGSYRYAHIYLDKQEYTYVEEPRFIGKHMSAGYKVRSNVTYHIRLNIEEETTSIIEYGDVEEIMCLPTLKLSPANVREKLKLYLLFS